MSVVQIYPLGRIDQVHLSHPSGNKCSVFTANLYLVSKLCLLSQKNCDYSKILSDECVQCEWNTRYDRGLVRWKRTLCVG